MKILRMRTERPVLVFWLPDGLFVHVLNYTYTRTFFYMTNHLTLRSDDLA